MKNGHGVVSKSVTKSVLIGLCITCATVVAAICSVAALLLRENLVTSQLYIYVPCLHFIALFTGALSAGFVSKEKTLYSVGILIVVYYFMCVAMTITIFDGRFAGVIADVISGVLGAGCAVMINAGGRRKRNRQFRKRKIC